MIKFKSKIFEEIITEGAIHLKAERKFKWFHNFDLIISKENQNLLSISSKTEFLNFYLNVTENNTNFQIDIQNQSQINFDGIQYEIKVDKMYPFKKKYAEILINDVMVGEVLFQQKFLNIILNFVPNEQENLTEENLLKITLLILINIVNVDGSSG